jgi:hypothetical protein
MATRTSRRIIPIRVRPLPPDRIPMLWKQPQSRRGRSRGGLALGLLRRNLSRFRRRPPTLDREPVLANGRGDSAPQNSGDRKNRKHLPRMGTLLRIDTPVDRDGQGPIDGGGPMEPPVGYGWNAIVPSSRSPNLGWMPIRCSEPNVLARSPAFGHSRHREGAARVSAGVSRVCWARARNGHRGQLRRMDDGGSAPTSCLSGRA